MQLNFTGKDFVVTPALKNHITEKFSHLEKHYHKISNVHVTLHLENLKQIAKAHLHIDHTDINATAEESDIYVAVDHLVAKLDTQLAKHKERLQDKRHDKAPSYDTE